MMKKRRSKKNRKLEEEEMDLQITSLADILIIVLVFLLSVFNSGIRGMGEVDVPDGVRLPAVSEGGSSEEGIQVQIGRNSVKLNDRLVSKLNFFRFQQADLNNDLPNSSTSKRVTAAFAKQRRAGQTTQPVWIVADRKAPYATIQTVLASAAAVGFTNIKLAVVTKQ